MASTPRPELSSAFDSMLAQTKKRFADLYRRGLRTLPRRQGHLSVRERRQRRPPPPSWAPTHQPLAG
jgi:hypothetical protein